MIDYEDLILARQEQIEIMEDNGTLPDDMEVEDIYNPIILRMIEEAKERKNGR